MAGEISVLLAMARFSSFYCFVVELCFWMSVPLFLTSGDIGKDRVKWPQENFCNAGEVSTEVIRIVCSMYLFFLGNCNRSSFFSLF